MNEFKKVFFSYSRVDGSDFVFRLATDLKKAGFNVWIDQQDIRAGSEWDLEIEKALETCDCLLFIESEKSVASNNVLDEVYYAIEQKKRVIPVILHDSKTPFRLQRLQHIDFTTGYEKGLVNLINELKTDPATETSQPDELKKPAKPYSTKSSTFILICTILVIIGAGAFIYSINIKKGPNQSTGTIVNLTDTPGGGNIVDKEPKAGSKNENPLIEKNDEKNENNRKNKNGQSKATDKIINLNEALAGNWDLVDVSPKAASLDGYMKIEETAEKKVSIKSFFQFYYFKTNDTAFLSVFNGFAGCTSCLLKNEMKITPEDIAIASQQYQMLKENRPGVGKAGDTIRNAGSNNSIRASVTLNFINDKTAVIKVQRTVAITLSSGIVVPPFVYSFRFSKID